MSSAHVNPKTLMPIFWNASNYSGRFTTFGGAQEVFVASLAACGCQARNKLKPPEAASNTPR